MGCASNSSKTTGITEEFMKTPQMLKGSLFKMDYDQAVIMVAIEPLNLLQVEDFFKDFDAFIYNKSLEKNSTEFTIDDFYDYFSALPNWIDMPKTQGIFKTLEHQNNQPKDQFSLMTENGFLQIFNIKSVALLVCRGTIY